MTDGTSLLHGQYTIDGFLNSGGFGITYRAKDSLGRLVVIKECFPGEICLRSGTKVIPRSPEQGGELANMVDQFVKEAHSLAALRHKNIVHVHQVFEENNTAYMAIDFVDGPDLLDIIETDHQRLTAEEIARMTRRMLAALKYTHDQGLLHRDISPDNILINTANEPILIDFGAARRRSGNAETRGAPLKFVKDGYSPREFYVEDAEQGPWSDIYSLAATLYHAITGVAPIDAQQRQTACDGGKADPYLGLAGRFGDYPDGFLEAIDTALALAPEGRFQTSGDWMASLSARRSKVNTQRLRLKTRELASAEGRRAGAPAELYEAEVRAGIVNSAPGAGAFRKRIMAAGLVAILAVGGVAFSVLTGFGTDGGTPVAATEVLSADTITTAAIAPLPTLPLGTSDAAPDVAPFVAIVAPTRSAFAADVQPLTPPETTHAPESRTRGPVAISTPVPAVGDAALGVDPSPPARQVPPTLSASGKPEQITVSHWDVDMPFDETLVQLRNAHTAQIVSVSDTANLSVSGDWIAPGVTIFALNGETLTPGMPISVHLLNGLGIDPDGFTRATVRYREPETGRIDRGLLAVPVLRQIALADGTRLEARVEDLAWRVRVIEPGPAFASELVPGDILLRETQTAVEITSHEALARAFEQLLARGASTASFDIQRAGAVVQISLPLAPNPAGVGR